MWNSSCRMKTHPSLPRQPSHGGVSIVAETVLICEPLMRILDHLPPIKMLSKEPCTCIVMPRWHCTEHAVHFAVCCSTQLLDTQISQHWQQHIRLRGSLVNIKTKASRTVLGAAGSCHHSASKQAQQCFGVSTDCLMKLVRIDQSECPKTMALSILGICARSTRS